LERNQPGRGQESLEIEQVTGENRVNKKGKTLRIGEATQRAEPEFVNV
jgi:hypothetical protein